MNKNNVILLAGLAVLVVVGAMMVLNQKDAVEGNPDLVVVETTTTVTPGLITSPVPTGQNVFVPLQTQGSFGQSGSATISENSDKKAVVKLTLMGGTFTKPQPAHIHVGSCPTPGAVKYPLTNVVSGMSETVLPVSLSELMATTDKLAINVHKSAEESSVYTACGDVMISPTGSMMSY